jgi:hypothetical protein
MNNRPANLLTGALDSKEANRLLRSLLAACSHETINQIASLFFDRNAPYQASAIFHHAFVAVEAPTVGADDSVVGFRLSDPPQFSLAICTLYRQKFVTSVHVNPPGDQTLVDESPL